MPRLVSLAALGAAFAVLVWLRKPDVLLHAELWGDDGWSWYPDAYAHGALSLLWPVNGYLNSLQRLVALAAQPLPLAWAPTVFALAALAIQVLPAVFLVSARMDRAWPGRWTRALFALIVLLLPNEIEFYVNLTNAQWNLALLAFLVLVADAPRSRAAWAFDSAVLLLCGLSGPFCLLLMPVALLELGEHRDGTRIARAALLGATALVQAGCLLAAPHGGRTTAPLGAGPVVFARIAALQILLGAELGYYAVSALPALAAFQGAALPLVVTAAGALLTLVALWRGGWLLRKFALFAALLLAGALASPQVTNTEPQWPVMAIPPMGNRYFTIPIICWVAVLFTLAADRRWLPRIAGAALLLVLLAWGIPHDFHELPMPRTDFQDRARAFAAAPPGTRMEFPLHPPGLTPMVLVKQAP